MKFFRGEFLIRERNHEYSLESVRATKLVPMQGYLCREEPSLGIYKDNEWLVILLDVGQFSEEHEKYSGTQITYRRTLREAKEIVEIIHENIEELNAILQQPCLSIEAPQWYKEIQKGKRDYEIL